MRSSWKCVYTIKNPFIKMNNVLVPRNITLTPILVNLNKNIQMHVGNSLFSLSLRGIGTGFKSGSFAYTKALGFRIHSAKKKQDKKKGISKEKK